MTSRDLRTGRFVATSNAPESREGKFPTMTDLPVEIEGADPAELAYDVAARRGPAADELAQFDTRSPLRARNPTLVHPDDEGHHNAILRTAARNAGPMDSSPFLTGLVGSPAPPTGIGSIRVDVRGDHNPLSPVRAEDIAPGRPVGRVRDVTDDEPMGEPRGDLRPASRGLGRDR